MWDITSDPPEYFRLLGQYDLSEIKKLKIVNYDVMLDRALTENTGFRKLFERLKCLKIQNSHGSILYLLRNCREKEKFYVSTIRMGDMSFTSQHWPQLREVALSDSDSLQENHVINFIRHNTQLTSVEIPLFGEAIIPAIIEHIPHIEKLVFAFD